MPDPTTDPTPDPTPEETFAAWFAGQSGTGHAPEEHEPLITDDPAAAFSAYLGATLSGYRPELPTNESETL